MNNINSNSTNNFKKPTHKRVASHCIPTSLHPTVEDAKIKREKLKSQQISDKYIKNYIKENKLSKNSINNTKNGNKNSNLFSDVRKKGIKKLPQLGIDDAMCGIEDIVLTSSVVGSSQNTAPFGIANQENLDENIGK